MTEVVISSLPEMTAAHRCTVSSDSSRPTISTTARHPG